VHKTTRTSQQNITYREYFSISSLCQKAQNGDEADVMQRLSQYNSAIGALLPMVARSITDQINNEDDESVLQAAKSSSKLAEVDGAREQPAILDDLLAAINKARESIIGTNYSIHSSEKSEYNQKIFFLICSIHFLSFC
jgi:hypothetical protein